MEELPAITPVNFFQLAVDCRKLEAKGPFPQLPSKNLSDYALPSLSFLCDEPQFAEVFVGWNESGLESLFLVNKPFEKVCYPDICAGDSVEVFIDTRDLKSSGYTTRFSHHFYVLPQAVDGSFAKEITRFRTEDTHEISDEALLLSSCTFEKKRYALSFFIPAESLFGYDPRAVGRLGFAYRINRPSGPPQHFSVVGRDVQIEQHPSLWCSMRLCK